MIAQIELKLKEMEPGLFQKICNLYVAREYKSVFAPGAQIGTNRTTPGTPDAYFVNEDGSYTFIEYTVQATSLMTKIKDDINKCLEYAKTNEFDLSGILYFHTSHVLSAKAHSQLSKLCSDYGCDLEIFDIARLADGLLNYPFLVKDELGLPIDTGQIMPLDIFVEKYDNRKLTAPLNVDLIGRESEVADITAMLNSQDVALLFGAAGLGKTRLAIEVCKKFREENKSYSVLCIFNNDIELFEDYRRYFSNKKDYLIFVDDCNQISSFRNLLDYVGDGESSNIKIIATVRDYAKEKVTKDIIQNESINFDMFNLTPLSDESIKEICKKNFNILNGEYLERIVDIAKGNPRLAVIASKTALDKTLYGINDATQLMEKYYDNVIDDSDLNEDDIVIIACTYLLKGIHLETEETVEKLLELTGLTVDTFKKRVTLMNNNEMIDQCEDTAIRSSEQILSCYLTYCALVKYKYLSLSEFLITFFEGRRERIIEGINGIFTYYRNLDIIEHFRTEIEEAWEYFESNKTEVLPEYMMAFHTIRPEKTLLYIKTEIESMNFQPHSGEYVIKKNSYNDLPQELQMLGSYSQTEHGRTAIDLVLKYSEKNQNEYEAILKSLTEYNGFGIKEHSVNYEYKEQLYIYEKLVEKSNNYEDTFFTHVLLEVSKIYLNIGYEFTKSKGHSVTFGEIPLVFCDSSKKMREMIWNTLLTLSQMTQYKAEIIDVFYNYELRHRFDSRENETEFAEFDYEFIKKIINNINLEDFNIVHACASMLKKLEWHDINVSELIGKCLENGAYNLYYILAGEKFDNNKYEFEERERLRNEKIIATVADYDTEQYIEMISTWNDIDLEKEKNRHDLWQLSKSMEFALLTCFRKDSLNYGLIFKNIMQMKINYNLSYGEIFIKAINKLGIKEVEEIINEYAKNERLFLKRVFLSVIDYNKLITDDNSNYYIEMLTEYIFDEMDSDSSNYIDFRLLKDYNKYEEGLLIRVLDNILTNYDDGLSRFSLHMALEYKGNPKEYISLFVDRPDLLKELYFAILKADQHGDYNNEYLKVFFQEGVISLNDYISFIKSFDRIMYMNPMAERLSCLWELENHDIYIDEALKILDSASGDTIEKLNNREIINSVFLTKNKDTIAKQDIWIEEYLITNIDDSNKLDPILEVIGMLSQERKLMHITTLVNHEVNIDVFKSIRFEPRSSSWSGSELPIIDKKIDFFESIKSILTGASFIEHRAYICDRITWMKDYRKQRHIDEFLRDF